MEGNMKKILIADDEESIRLLYKEELEEEGYEVIIAKDGNEAFEKYGETNPDLIILDIKMPGLNGIEVMHKIREQSRDVPIILCTAYGEYKQNFATWASEAYVVKSANMEGLINKVREILTI
jgi:DNA-binding response OmpR family regulator